MVASFSEVVPAHLIYLILYVFEQHVQLSSQSPHPSNQKRYLLESQQVVFILDHGLITATMGNEPAGEVG
jgi:hypothetical protein